MLTANELVQLAHEQTATQRTQIDELMYVNQQRVIKAFNDNRVSARHFSPTNGYGYDDVGRDTLDKVFAQAMFCQDALVRPQIVNGSHAIYLALSGLAVPNSTVLSITGDPYDTLQTAIGLCGEATNTLNSNGVQFVSIPLMEDGGFDFNAITDKLDDKNISVVYLQRSRGYSWRLALSIAQIGQCLEIVKAKRPDVCVLVDNCYGEFTEQLEPTAVGADVIAGSLIKNPGGGIAPTGGYIAGKANYINKVADRLTVPGMGREVGSYAASYRPFYQGLFMAPHTTGQCLLTATLLARVFEIMGYESMPKSSDNRSDIIQAVKLNSPEGMKRMCKAIQQAAPVDSFVTPEAWDMPGYEDRVIMAAGAFVQGATTELSADGPIREPYIVYIQGGLTYEHGRCAAVEVARSLLAANDMDA
ncbi:MAG: methionine gamma-lyase family protein [Eubacteriales bacterium]|nr:methionine gamma-lyase family protein [Eubacteriales bacterium]